MSVRRAILLLAVVGLALGLASFVWHDASLIAWLAQQQRRWHRQLAAGFNALAGERSQAAAMTLIGVSLLYGIFHAAGPGHGKAAIAAWLLTQPSRLARGVAMAVAAALLQGLVAVLLVGSVLLLADWLPALSNDLVVGWSERVAFGLLIGVGVLILWRGASAVRHHGPGCQCRHGLEAERIARAQNWRGAVGIVLAVGARPCSGAILILALAKTLDSIWTGVMAVLAMSAGTALTTALLAILTVRSRAWITGLFANGERHNRQPRVIRMIGGGVLVLLGASLLLASFNAPHPLRM